jgi:hypothetical protein
MGDHDADMGKMRNANKILTEKPEWKGAVGMRMCIWDDNIKVEVPGSFSFRRPAIPIQVFVVLFSPRKEMLAK